MLLGLAGVSGIGKSHYKNLLVDRLGFRKVKIITTRAPRPGEAANHEKIFMSTDELTKARERGEIAFDFEEFGHIYAYPKSELIATIPQQQNLVVEIHYSTISEIKKTLPNLQTIYLYPDDLTIPKAKVHDRQLSPAAEQQRLDDIDRHYQLYKTNSSFRQAFGHLFCNHYDLASETAFLDLVNSLLSTEETYHA